MRAFSTKPIHPKVMLHYHNLTFSKKKQKFDFEGYFDLLEKGRFVLTFTRRCNNNKNLQ